MHRWRHNREISKKTAETTEIDNIIKALLNQNVAPIAKPATSNLNVSFLSVVIAFIYNEKAIRINKEQLISTCTCFQEVRGKTYFSM